MKSIKSTISLIYLIQFVLLNSSCTNDPPEPQNKTLTYQNIIIMSDLSNRLKTRNCRDTIIIREIINKFKKECVKPGEKIGDRSSLSFSIFNTPNFETLDMGDIKKIEEKQQFVNSTGKYKNTGLDYRLNLFFETVLKTYKNNEHTYGLNLIGLLLDKIENDIIIKKDTFSTDGLDTTFIKYDNHVYIFTDGYLETKGKPLNTSEYYYFSSNEINRVREYAVLNNVSPRDALRLNTSLRLPKKPQKNNSLVQLHILETDDRKYNPESGKSEHPDGLNDNDILKAVWKQWAEDSRFKGELKWKSLNHSIPAVLH
jgi:hypothetical protein